MFNSHLTAKFMPTSQEESRSGEQFSKTSVISAEKNDQRDSGSLRHSPTPATISKSVAATTETEMTKELHCSRCDLMHCKPPTLGSQYEAITRCQQHCSYDEPVTPMKLSSLDSSSELVLKHQRQWKCDAVEKLSTLGLKRHEPTKCQQHGTQRTCSYQDTDVPHCCRETLSDASCKDFAMGQIGFRVRSKSLPSNTYSQPQHILYSTRCPLFPSSNSNSTSLDLDTNTASETSSWTGSQFTINLANSGESLLT